MKSISAVLREVDGHLSAGWYLDAAGRDAGRWPRDFVLGKVTSAEADQRYAEVMIWSHGWHEWTALNPGTLRQEPRRIRGISNQLPTHITITDPDAAAQAVGNGWPRRLARARQRATEIEATFPGADVPLALRLADPLDAVDFELACTAARWFADHPTEWPGLTPRQVPVAGLHAKWLNSHLPLVKVLAGLARLDLAERGTRVYWTYLDPAYRRTGERLHDSLTIGDQVPLPYTPDVVLVVENKDSAILFPEMSGAIVVEGNGNAAVGLLPQVSWIAAAKLLVYWGDLDARGYEIVDGLRSRLTNLQTILMDLPTYEKYEVFSTNLDERGIPLKARKRRLLPTLTADERAVYDHLTDAMWPRNRRLEQERIPLQVALTQLRDIFDRDR